MLIIYSSKAEYLTSDVDEATAEVIAYFEGYTLKVIWNSINGRVGDFSMNDFSEGILWEAQT